MRNFIKVLKCKRGQAMVEMALALPVLVLILMGIIDFGRIIHEQQELTAAAREGARRAAVTQTESVATLAAQNMAAGIPAGEINVSFIWGDTTTRAPGTTVTVSASHTPQIFYSKIADLVTNSMNGGTFTLTGTAVMRVE